jgi:hypothetical protein
MLNSNMTTLHEIELGFDYAKAGEAKRATNLRLLNEAQACADLFREAIQPSHLDLNLRPNAPNEEHGGGFVRNGGPEFATHVFIDTATDKGEVATYLDSVAAGARYSLYQASTWNKEAQERAQEYCANHPVLDSTIDATVLAEAKRLVSEVGRSRKRGLLIGSDDLTLTLVKLRFGGETLRLKP